MSLFDEKLNKIEEAQSLRSQNIYNYVPFLDVFPKFSEVMPGIFPGTMYKLLSYTSIGKSTFTRFMTILYPYNIYKKYQFKFKTIYFALEESKEDFIDNFILFVLFNDFNIILDKNRLNGYSNKLLTSFELDCIKKTRAKVEDILQHVEIYDNDHHPTKMYITCRDISQKLGEHTMIHKTSKTIISYNDYNNLTQSEKLNYSYNGYKQHDPNLIVMVVCDQLNNIIPEKREGVLLSQIEAIKRWSMDYCRLTITKQWKWAVWNVQQLAFAGESSENQRSNMVKPSLDKAGNSKEVLRDDMVVFGLFSPWRYKIKQDSTSFGDYDVSRFQNNYRNLSLLKNRHGRVGIEIPLFFKPEIGTFIELPEPSNPLITQYFIN